MKYALLRPRRSLRTEAGSAGVKLSPRPGHDLGAVTRQAEPCAAASGAPATPVRGRREISLGGNDGVRTVTLREANIEWRRRKSLAPAIAGEIQPATDRLAIGKASVHRRALLSISK